MYCLVEFAMNLEGQHMIFVNKEWDEIDDIIVYSNYHKYCRIKN